MMEDKGEGPQYLVVGEILRPHGVTGELRMRIMTDYPERIPTVESVYLSRREDDPQPRPARVTGMRMHQGYGLLRLQNIADRDAADRLRGQYVMIGIADAVPLAEGEFYLYELIGMEIVTETGEVIGTLREVLETGANDVYIVDSAQYGEVLIPVIPDIILQTERATKRITVRLPDGLIANHQVAD